MLLTNYIILSTNQPVPIIPHQQNLNPVVNVQHYNIY